MQLIPQRRSGAGGGKGTSGRAPKAGRQAGLALVGLISFIVVADGARADDLVTMRGNYYLERSTRVIQPSVDLERDVTPETTLDVHYLLDEITSASTVPTASPTVTTGPAFSELRNEVGLGLSHLWSSFRLGAQARFSDESDYRSTFGTVDASVNLFENDTTLNASFSDGYDVITQPGRVNLMSFFHETLETQIATLGLAQVLTPDLLATLDFEGSRLHGYQSNQYRYAIVAGNLVAEDDPRYRLRGVVAGGLRYHYRPTGTSLVLGYRFYDDDWGVEAHTPDVQLYQQLGPQVLARIEYRYYTQTGAYFYQPIYDMPGPGGYVTADPKLSPFTGHTIGAGLSVGLENLAGTALAFLKDGRLDLLYEYIVQYNRYGNANEAALGVTFPY